MVVDMENITGGGLRTTAAAAWARRIVETAVAVVPGEQVVVGVSSIDGLFHAKKSWPQARVVLGLGRDGADHALLDVLDHEDCRGAIRSWSFFGGRDFRQRGSRTCPSRRDSHSIWMASMHGVAPATCCRRRRLP